MYSSADTVDITWSPPFTLSGVPINGYVIIILSTTTNTTTTHTSVFNNFTFTTTDHDPCTNYSIKVFAFNSVGNGSLSSSVSLYFPQGIYCFTN